MHRPDEKPSTNILSRLRFLLAVAAVLLLTFLFFKSRTVDLSKHEEFQGKLRRLKEVDSQLNQNLLKLGYLLLNYDPIVTELSELRALREDLDNVPPYLGRDGTDEVRSALAEFGQASDQKELMVQRLRSANVRLKGSLNYLPVLSGEVAQMAPPGPRAQRAVAQLKDLLRDVLLYNLTLDKELIKKVEDRIDKLGPEFATAGRSLDPNEMDLILTHVKRVMEYKPQITNLTRNLVELPTGELAQKAQNSYDRHFEKATMRADAYRAYLYIFSIALLVYIAHIIIQLRQLTQELNASNENLEERVRERTRELDLSESRNRALLNATPDLMLRLDRGGSFLDAKDSTHVSLGLPIEQLQGKHVSEVFPEFAEGGMDAIQQALDTGEAQTVDFGRREEGHLRDFEARIVVSGQNQVLVIVRDITDQKRAVEKVAEAQRRSEELLHNILPEEVATELKVKGTVEPKYFEDVSILFTNFVGFSTSTESLAAEELVFVLHDYFTAFDEITFRYRLEKLKTVGDNYMCVGGLPKRKPSHPVDVVMAALEMVRAVQERDRPDSLVHWTVRIGVHTGPVVAGVVGIEKFAFDVFGQSVNLSSRLESASEDNRINLSADTHSRVKDFFSCTHRGKIGTRDREVDMFFVDGVLPSLIDAGESPPPAFRNRYQIYFQSEPPSFPSNIASTGRLCLSARSGKVPSDAIHRDRQMGI